MLSQSRFQSRFLAGIAASLSAVGSVLMVIALVLDELFAGVININDDVRCGWENRRVSESDGFESIDHLAGSEMRVAGLLWFSFAIGSTALGLAGALCSCIACIPSFRLPGTGCMFLAGIFAFVAAASIFAFWAEYEYVCADRLKVGASVILAFIAGSLLLFATCFMCVSRALAAGEQCGSSPSCYDSYDSYNENYCQPVQMQRAKCVPVRNDCAPNFVPCAPASPQCAPRCVPVCRIVKAQCQLCH